MGSYKTWEWKESPREWPEYRFQVVCIDCGDSKLLPPGAEDQPGYVCAKCEFRRLTEDRTGRDAQGRRICTRCAKVVARLNMGPFCYACELSDPPATTVATTQRKTVPPDIRRQIVAAYIGGKTLTVVAGEYGVAASTAAAIVREAGITVRSVNQARADSKSARKATAVELAKKGHSAVDIASAVGIAERSVRRLLQEAGFARPRPERKKIVRPEKPARVGGRGCRALSDEERAELCARYAVGGVSKRRLADDFLVDESTVRAILKRQEET